MPRATVTGNEGNDHTHASVPERLTHLYGVGRGGHTVEVIGDPERDDRVFVQVVSGPSKGCTYSLPRHELFIPQTQPFIDLTSDLPYDRHIVVDDPDSPTCPHTIQSNREMVYDDEMGLWVHGIAACRRPQAIHLRQVTGADGGHW